MADLETLQPETMVPAHTVGRCFHYYGREEPRRARWHGGQGQRRARSRRAAPPAYLKAALAGCALDCADSTSHHTSRPPTPTHWTKSLRDSLELTALVMLRGMRWYIALDRGWNVVPRRTSPLTDGRERRTLLAWKERADTILILHASCHSAASARARHRWSAPSSN